MISKQFHNEFWLFILVWTSGFTSYNAGPLRTDRNSNQVVSVQITIQLRQQLHKFDAIPIFLRPAPDTTIGRTTLHKQTSVAKKQNRKNKRVMIKVASDRPSSKMSSWYRQSMLTVQQPILIITGQDQLHTYKNNYVNKLANGVNRVRFKVLSAPFQGSKTGITVFLLVISSSTSILNRSKTRKSNKKEWVESIRSSYQCERTDMVATADDFPFVVSHHLDPKNANTNTKKHKVWWLYEAFPG